jgi:hypothetical protein
MQQNPRKRANQVRGRISYLSSEQLERFLKAAKEYGSREHAKVPVSATALICV